MNNGTTMTIAVDKEIEEYHHHKRRRKLIKLLIASIVWLLIIIYLATPLSTYKMMHVKGNVYLSEMDVIELGGIKRVWWWSVDYKKLKEKLEEYENIDNVSVTFGIKGINISILEKYPLAIRDGKYVMNTTSTLLEKDKYPYNIEKLVDISSLDEELVAVFVSEYIRVNLEIRELFYEASMIDDKIMLLLGKINEECYFKIRLNLDCLSIKLNFNKFSKIKEEILGKVKSNNVQYDKDNPCLVEYDFTNIYEYRIV